MNKTVTVLVERRVKHSLYGKFVTRSHKYHAHDENNEYKTGDLVEIVACRKLAKTKAYRVKPPDREGEDRLTVPPGIPGKHPWTGRCNTLIRLVACKTARFLP